jgi:hypothetical protein
MFIYYSHIPSRPIIFIFLARGADRDLDAVHDPDRNIKVVVDGTIHRTIRELGGEEKQMQAETANGKGQNCFMGSLLHPLIRVDLVSKQLEGSGGLSLLWDCFNLRAVETDGL